MLRHGVSTTKEHSGQQTPEEPRQIDLGFDLERPRRTCRLSSPHRRDDGNQATLAHFLVAAPRHPVCAHHYKGNSHARLPRTSSRPT